MDTRTPPALNASLAGLPAGQLLDALVATLPALVFVADAAGGNLYVNAGFQAYAGLAAETLLGDGWLSIVHPDDRAGVMAAWEAAVRAGEPYEVEYRLRAADGAYRWFLGRGAPHRGEGGAVRCWMGICTDIDDRKRAEERDRAAAGRVAGRVGVARDATEGQAGQAQAGALLASISDGFLALDRDWRIAAVNARGLEILAPLVGDGCGLLGRIFWEAFPEVESTEFGRAYHRAAETGEPQAVEGFYPPLERWFDVRCYPSAEGLGILFLDVTNRRRAEDELRLRTAELESLLVAAPLGVAFFDRQHRYLRVNDELAELNGLPAVDHIGERIEDLLPVNAPSVVPHLDRVFATGETVRGVEVSGETPRAPGEVHTWLTSYYPVRGSGGEVVAVGSWVVAITAQKQAEAAWRESEGKLRAVLEAVPVGLVFADATGRVTGGNARVEELVGHPVLPSPDIEAYGEWISFHPDGRRVEAREYPLARVLIGEAERPELEVLYRRGDGRDAWIRFAAAAVRGPDGAVEGGVVASIDVDRQRRAEAELAAALEAKEALLFEVNHRVKNNLQVVTGLLTLQASKATHPEVKRDLADAQARIGVVASIHQSLYSTASHSEVEMATFLRQLAEATLASLGASERIALGYTADGAAVLPLETAMPLALVVSELLTNAVKYAFPAGQAGRIRVALRQADGVLAVELADDGVGLPLDFQPARSLGVGMKVIAMLTRQLGTRLEVMPTVRGAAFRIVLPSR